MEILYNIFGNILEILIIFLGIEGLHILNIWEWDFLTSNFETENVFLYAGNYKDKKNSNLCYSDLDFSTTCY